MITPFLLSYNDRVKVTINYTLQSSLQATGRIVARYAGIVNKYVILLDVERTNKSGKFRAIEAYEGQIERMRYDE
jgi:hypothetical protein